MKVPLGAVVVRRIFITIIDSKFIGIHRIISKVLICIRIQIVNRTLWLSVMSATIHQNGSPTIFSIKPILLSIPICEAFIPCSR